ncbi:hypothetical protein U9M48_013798 [Paspalum notatum var. saurae]|uniref:Reverse transcriptase zinc-binding domain-containing protein n=1 Tax=Paspalum notatum var. saurae TaxID=547442 RepID=A0AAQ3T0N3_PASNO
MYKFLVNNGVNVPQEMWRVRVPLKVKKNLWYLKREVILTKDNLAKRNWKGRGRKNNLTLLAGAASICWALWLIRNDSVFDKRKLKTYLGTHWLRFWAQLQRMDDQRNLLVKACQRLEPQATHFFASRGWPFAFHLSC